MSVPNRKAVSWRKDPAILARMAEVEDHHLRGLSNVKIAVELGIDETTVRRDLKRCLDLVRERVGDDIEHHKARAVAVYRKVQSEAWQAFKTTAGTSLNRSAYLNTIKGAEDSIAKVLGITTKLTISFELRKEAERLAAELGLTAEQVMKEAGLLEAGAE